MSQTNNTTSSPAHTDPRKRPTNEKSNPLEDGYIDSVTKRQRSASSPSYTGNEIVQLSKHTDRAEDAESVEADQVVGADTDGLNNEPVSNDDVVTLVDSQDTMHSHHSKSPSDAPSKTTSLPPSLQSTEASPSLGNDKDASNETASPQPPAGASDDKETTKKDQDQDQEGQQVDSKGDPAADTTTAPTATATAAASETPSETAQEKPSPFSFAGGGINKDSKPFVLNSDLSLFSHGQHVSSSSFTTPTATATAQPTISTNTFGSKAGFQGFTFSAFKSSGPAFGSAAGKADGKDTKTDGGDDDEAKSKQTAAFQSLFSTEGNTGSIFGSADEPADAAGATGPTIQLAPVEVVTGEEQDETLFSGTAAVYVLDGGQYKERGHCDVSVNLSPSPTDSTRKVGRVIARNAVLHHVVFHELVYPQSSFTALPEKPTYARFTTISAEKKLAAYLLKFQTAADCTRFIHEADKAKNRKE